MPPNDIIDNRDEKLIDHIPRIPPGSRSAKFAVGYSFLSGLEVVADQVGHVEKSCLLIGNTVGRQTIEHTVVHEEACQFRSSLYARCS